MLGSDAVALLDALHDPALVIDDGGEVWFANRAAKRLLGFTEADRHLPDLIGENSEAARQYLDRCLGSGEPLTGSLTLSLRGEAQTVRCKGNAFFASGRRLVLLRMYDSAEHPFAALTRTIADLKEELKKRQRSEARLEESLRDRELLHRELEHRVKNNMQMLSAMLLGAQQEATSPEAKRALEDASSRFAAVSSVQQLLYQSDTLSTVDSEALVATLLRAAASIASHPVETTAKVDPIPLPINSAVPIGLMLNELLTNAMKYGRREGVPQKLDVDFVRDANQIMVAVTDNGPGFELTEPRKRASGLGLVRGLLRQLGGSIHVERDNGARCVLRFPDVAATDRAAA